MPRQRSKLRNIAEISCLDGSSVRRLCSSSVPERREAAIQEVVRRATAWDSQCQDYARKLRRQCPDVVLRCSVTAPDPSLPVCREFRLPPDVGAGVLAATDQKSSEIAPPPDDLDILLQEGLGEFCARDFHNVTLPAAACVTQTLTCENPALQPPSTVARSGPLSLLEPHAAPLQDVSVRRRIRGGRKWRQSSSASRSL